jgi:hypothetical protein
MKKLTVSLMATLAVVLLSSSSFSANANAKEGMASDRAASNAVVENPALTLTEGSFLTDQYGVAPAWNDPQVKAREGRMENPALTSTIGSFVIDQYGAAPAWNDRQIKARGEIMENPSLIGIFDNVE